MDHKQMSAVLMFLVSVVCVSLAEDLESVADPSNDLLEVHIPQKRSAGDLLTSGDDVILSDSHVLPALPFAMEDPSKRGSLLRFGKRGGSLFRFGKRGSLFRFGKRGSLLRFGKRGGSLFRFGRSGPADIDEQEEDKRSSLFRFGKRSDNELYRDAFLDDVLLKRGVDGFHWGAAGDEE